MKFSTHTLTMRMQELFDQPSVSNTLKHCAWKNIFVQSRFLCFDFLQTYDSFHSHIFRDLFSIFIKNLSTWMQEFISFKWVINCIANSMNCTQNILRKHEADISLFSIVLFRALFGFKRIFFFSNFLNF